MKKSPKAGDAVMACEHVQDYKPAHIAYAPDGISFQRPDGTKNTCSWLACCHHCFVEAVGDFLQVHYKQDFILNTTPTFQELQ